MELFYFDIHFIISRELSSTSICLIFFGLRLIVIFVLAVGHEYFAFFSFEYGMSFCEKHLTSLLFVFCLFLLCFFTADLKLIFACNHLYVSIKVTEFCPINLYYRKINLFHKTDKYIVNLFVWRMY